MAGFGTAVAIPAAILISLGFKPIFSATVSLIANSVATAFGAIGTPVLVLAKETNLDVLQPVSYTHLSVYFGRGGKQDVGSSSALHSFCAAYRGVDARTANLASCLFGHSSESGEGYDCIHLYVRCV